MSISALFLDTLGFRFDELISPTYAEFTQTSIRFDYSYTGVVGSSLFSFSIFINVTPSYSFNGFESADEFAVSELKPRCEDYLYYSDFVITIRYSGHFSSGRKRRYSDVPAVLNLSRVDFPIEVPPGDNGEYRIIDGCSPYFGCAASKPIDVSLFDLVPVLLQMSTLAFESSGDINDNLLFLCLDDEFSSLISSQVLSDFGAAPGCNCSNVTDRLLLTPIVRCFGEECAQDDRITSLLKSNVECDEDCPEGYQLVNGVCAKQFDSVPDDADVYYAYIGSGKRTNLRTGEVLTYDDTFLYWIQFRKVGSSLRVRAAVDDGSDAYIWNLNDGQVTPIFTLVDGFNCTPSDPTLPRYLSYGWRRTARNTNTGLIQAFPISSPIPYLTGAISSSGTCGGSGSGSLAIDPISGGPAIFHQYTSTFSYYFNPGGSTNPDLIDRFVFSTSFKFCRVAGGSGSAKFDIIPGSCVDFEPFPGIVPNSPPVDPECRLLTFTAQIGTTFEIAGAEIDLYIPLIQNTKCDRIPLAAQVPIDLLDEFNLLPNSINIGPFQVEIEIGDECFGC